MVQNVLTKKNITSLQTTGCPQKKSNQNSGVQTKLAILGYLLTQKVPIFLDCLYMEPPVLTLDICQKIIEKKIKVDEESAAGDVGDNKYIG